MGSNDNSYFGDDPKKIILKRQSIFVYLDSEEVSP